MAPKVLIIGSGISGIASANLLKNNYEVWLIEKSDRIGGLSRNFSCKATDVCNYCGWCLVNENINQLESAPYSKNIHILTSSNVISCSVKNDIFNVEIDNGKEIKKQTFNYIFLASGSSHFDPARKPRFLYSGSADILSGHNLEQELRTSDFSKVESVGFIQCVGSRDESINALYCSKVCCRYALRMANYLSYKYPDLKITLFYMDLQVQGSDINSIYNKMKKNKNIEFVRGIPAQVHKNTSDKLVCRIEATDSTTIENVTERVLDKLILSNGLTPNPDNNSLVDLFDLNLDDYGFIKTSNQGYTNIKNIFAVGTAVAPLSIKDSIINAKAICGAIL